MRNDSCFHSSVRTMPMPQRKTHCSLRRTTRVAAGLVAAATVLLSGCQTMPAGQAAGHDALLARAPELNEALFGAPRPVPDFAQLTALTPEQKDEFRRYFHSTLNQNQEPHKRVYAFLTDHLADTDFVNRTHPAADAIANRRGNCMSLALVTAAYARLADIEVGWQLADSDPVYSSEGSVIYSANHIQTRLYRKDIDRHFTRSDAFGRAYLLVDYFTDSASGKGKPLRESEAIALTYQNLGIEAMTEGSLEEAFWLLRAGLKHDPANANLYNALAVLHRRTGDAQTAEDLYRFALGEFGDRLVILRNYRKLLLASGRTQEAGRLEQRIMQLADPDPYPLIALGDEAAEQGKRDTALGYYRKAGEVAPYLHEVYLKIARVHVDGGDLKRAQRALRKAREQAWAADDQKRYTAKLAALDAD